MNTVLKTSESVYEDVVYHICKESDPVMILFNTMGGNRLDSRYTSDGEWSSRLKFQNISEAESFLKNRSDTLVGTAEEVPLAILKIRTITTTNEEVIKTDIMDELSTKLSNDALMRKFEKFMADNSSWSLNALLMLRSTSGAKYDHTAVQASFETFCALHNTIPEK